MSREFSRPNKQVHIALCTGLVQLISGAAETAWIILPPCNRAGLKSSLWV